MIEARRRRRERVASTAARRGRDEDFATAQFYHVIATNHFPYHVCGAQQDNSHALRTEPQGRAASTSATGAEAGGGESGYIAVARRRSRHRLRRQLRQPAHAEGHAHRASRANVNPWPDNPMGHPAMDLKYRFQWTFPIVVSPHDPNVAVRRVATCVHQHDERRAELDGDLARSHAPRSGDARRLGRSDHEGPDVGRVLRDDLRDRRVAGHAKGVSGRAPTTARSTSRATAARRGQNVTPKDMAKFTRVSSIDASHFGAGTAYVAANRYQLDDDQAVSLEDDRLRQDAGRASTTASTATEFTRVDARGSREARPARTPARSAASGSRSTTARTGSRCSSTCRSCRCTISRSRRATSSLATHGRSLLDHGRHLDAASR